jgi:rubrerythrin
MASKDEFGVNEHTRPEEAVKVAMQRERTAHDFYMKCASIVQDPGVKKMFEFLAKEETKHFDLLEKEYDRFLAGEN